MVDAADQVVADDARAMELMEASLRQQRIADAKRPYDPDKPRHCGDCGIEIPRERLQAWPRTGRCIACERIAEEAYKSRWRGG